MPAALGVLLSRIGIQAGDDAVDVGFDVDAGLVLEFALAVFVHRQGAADFWRSSEVMISWTLANAMTVASRGTYWSSSGPPWRLSAPAGNPT